MGSNRMSYLGSRAIRVLPETSPSEQICTGPSIASGPGCLCPAVGPRAGVSLPVGRDPDQAIRLAADAAREGPETQPPGQAQVGPEHEQPGVPLVDRLLGIDSR